MTPIESLDFLVAVSVQITLVVMATALVSRFVWRAAVMNRVVLACFVSLLIMTGLDLVTPHYRLGGIWGNFGGDWIAQVVRWQWYLGQIVTAIWLAGIAVGIVLYIYRSVRLAIALRRDCEVLELSRLARRLEISIDELPKGLNIVTTGRFSRPFCIQFHRPWIVIPRFVLALNAPSLRLIVRHELAHLATEHPLQLFLHQVCQILFWFHPAVWWVARQAEHNREFLCDELTASTREQAATYLRAVLWLFSATMPAHGLAFGSPRTSLRQRTAYLLRSLEQPSARNHPIGRYAPAVVVTVCMLVASQCWFPLNVLASQRPGWSPWPRWTAGVLHDFGIHAPDFEEFDRVRQLHRAFNDSGQRPIASKAEK